MVVNFDRSGVTSADECPASNAGRPGSTRRSEPHALIPWEVYERQHDESKAVQKMRALLASGAEQCREQNRSDEHEEITIEVVTCSVCQ